MTEVSLADTLARAIGESRPISVAKYMAAANAHYYATRDPFGVDGDFTTAPEISQMFGELVGLWLADMVLRSGNRKAHYVELGPGRGTLASDALRAMKQFGIEPEIHLIETSPVLRAKQAGQLPGARWHDRVATLPTNIPLLIIANEFFDALPIHQIVRASDGWRQRMVAYESGQFALVDGPQVPLSIIPDLVQDSAEGSIIETCPEAVDIMRQLCQRIGEQGGALLVIDYGYEGPAVGDTLQAVTGHHFASAFEDPGECDLTAHIDFTTLGAMGELCGVAVHGPVDQGLWLSRLGLMERAMALSLAHPERSAEIMAAARRLSVPDEMGRLFKVLAVHSGDWPVPSGFDEGQG